MTKPNQPTSHQFYDRAKCDYILLARSLTGPAAAPGKNINLLRPQQQLRLEERSLCHVASRTFNRRGAELMKGAEDIP